MNAIHQLVATASAWLWPALADHLWQATLFAAILYAATILLRNGPARLRHSLWMLASIKLLTPAALLVLLAERAGITLSRLTSSALESPDNFLLLEPASALSGNYQVSVTAAQGLIHSEVYCLITLTWLIGCLLLLVLWTTRRRKFMHAFKCGREVQNGREWKLFNLAKSTLGLKTNVDLVLTPHQTEPIVARFWKPAVLLPESIGEHLDDSELEAIMLHELIHVQRRDNLIGNLQMAVCALLWFHPLVWFISRRLIAERENACDEKVLEVGAVPEAYAASILKVVRFSFGWKVAGVSGAGNGSNLRRRIKNIMSSKNSERRGPWSRLFAGSLIGLALIWSVVIGVNGRARGMDNSMKGEQRTATLFESVLPLNVQRKKKAPRKMPPPPPPPENPAPPPPPAESTTPIHPVAPAAPTSETPASPASAPAPPSPEKRHRSKKNEQDDTEKGDLIEAPRPVYPDDAKRDSVSGTVSVAIVIGEDGNVISARAQDGPQALRAAAVEAAYKARFRPATVKGKPVKVSGALSYNFALEEHK